MRKSHSCKGLVKAFKEWGPDSYNDLFQEIQLASNKAQLSIKNPSCLLASHFFLNEVINGKKFGKL